MGDDQLKKYKEELAKKSIERLKCIVCLERMSKPLTFCNTGHLSCSSCQLDLEKCPLCLSYFSKDRNFALEQMLDLCLFPCKNQIYGCTVIDGYDAINIHEINSCNFLQLQCFLQADDDDDKCCGKIITYCHFKEHIIKEHLKREKVSYKDEMKTKGGPARFPRFLKSFFSRMTSDGKNFAK